MSPQDMDALPDELRDLTVILLRFVAAYCVFDAMNVVFVSTIKGAGDTRFIMWSIGTLSLAVMILPIYIGVEIFDAGIYFAWSCATCFIFLLFTVSFRRYLQGRWKKIRVVRSPAQSPDGQPFSGQA